MDDPKCTSEIWKSIPGFPFYEASNHGRIRTIPRVAKRVSKNGNRSDMHLKSRILTPQRHRYNKKTGRPAAMLLRLLDESETYKTVYVHHMILFAFVGPKPDEMECCHYDGDASNNRLENLRWGTSKDNSADIIRHGRYKAPPHRFGENGTRAKLTNKQIVEILDSEWGRRGIGSGLARRFGVTNSAIYEVRRRYRNRPDLEKSIRKSVT